jgi:Putative zinc-finger
VSCQQARELFSAWVDGEAMPAERASVEEHLRACTDCRRELDRFRHTLALLRAVEPVRAPAGFAGRVLARARPAPRPRLLERVFRPLGAKLPLHAAAIVMVGVLVAYVVRETPDRRRAGPGEAFRAAAPGGVRSGERVTGGAGPVLPQATPAPTRPPAARVARATSAPSEPTRRTEPAVPAARRADDVMAKSAAAPAAPRSMTAEPAAAVLPGILTVRDRADARRALAELVARLGGAELSEHSDDEAVVVEVVVPAAAYAEFVRGLGRIGTWAATREPAGAPVRVRVTLKSSG